MGKKNKIRAIAVCVFRHDDQILVNDGFDSAKQMAFCRPLGGGVDFGETSRDAVIREIKEELGVEMTAVTLLGILESIFEYEGANYHEIVFVYDAQLVDQSLYGQVLEGVEGKRTFKAQWRALADLRAGNPRLVPEQLWELL